MHRSRSLSAHGLADRFAAFVVERHPFASGIAVEALEAIGGRDGVDEASIEALRDPFAAHLRSLLDRLVPRGAGDTTPGITAPQRFTAAVEELIDACDGFLRREAIRASLTRDERREILRGMVLTRATDNRLKTFFTGGEVRYGAAAFQGKGFRSLGQEAIYAAAIRLRRGEPFRDGGQWRGDVVAPLIRDLGVAIAMRPGIETIRRVLSAQMGKAGPPMNGKDLHIGDLEYGVLPAAAPLAIGSLTISCLLYTSPSPRDRTRSRMPSSA